MGLKGIRRRFAGGEKIGRATLRASVRPVGAQASPGGSPQRYSGSPTDEGES